jgi:methylated-DNA-[protein]-cysteine S-methyltransferase
MNRYTYTEGPIGPILLTSDGAALTGLYTNAENRPTWLGADWIEDATAEPLPAAICQLAEYFSGSRRDFDVPLSFQGTEFQLRVWRMLTTIQYGDTCSYGDLARRLDNPGASRAVGLANGRNPISIIVPCHRVIGADGSLTGYGGGLERKRWLLAHEGLHGFARNLSEYSA